MDCATQHPPDKTRPSSNSRLLAGPHDRPPQRNSRQAARRPAPPQGRSQQQRAQGGKRRRAAPSLSVPSPAAGRPAPFARVPVALPNAARPQRRASALPSGSALLTARGRGTRWRAPRSVAYLLRRRRLLLPAMRQGRMPPRSGASSAAEGGGNEGGKGASASQGSTSCGGRAVFLAKARLFCRSGRLEEDEVLRAGTALRGVVRIAITERLPRRSIYSLLVTSLNLLTCLLAVVCVRRPLPLYSVIAERWEPYSGGESLLCGLTAIYKRMSYLAPEVMPAV